MINKAGFPTQGIIDQKPAFLYWLSEKNIFVLNVMSCEKTTLVYPF